MEWTFEIDPAARIAEIRTRGVLDGRSAERMRNETMAHFKAHGIVRCLLDHSGLEGSTLGTLDIYGMPKAYDKLDFPRDFRLALIYSPLLAENARFFETVCRNNGYEVSVFNDRQAALDWLMR